MFKLHRHKSDRLGEVEFKLSNLQAIKVPRGWDRLVLSVISVESGKVVAKTSKATVRSGNCQWTETESIWLPLDDSSKELKEYHLKIVVSLASFRSAILGEATLNLEDCLSKEDSGPLLLPLKKCDFGTTLQVKIQSSVPKSKFRVGKSRKETNSLEVQNNNDDLDSKLDGSDRGFNKSDRSSINHLGGSSCQDEPGNRVTYFSASESHRSSDSGDSFDKSAFSPQNSLSESQYARRQDSSGSYTSATYGARTGDELLRSNPSSFNSRTSGSSVRNQSEGTTSQPPENGRTIPPSIRPSDSSKDLLEASEVIDDLHDEVQMWERHSRQLKLDLDILKKEISQKSKHQENLDRLLSAANTERDSLKLEVEQLKAVLKESMTNKSDISGVINKDVFHVQKELEDELKFHKDSNANLNQQLRKTQQSNIELVAVLQELEEIIEKQRLEIANLQNHVDEDGHNKNRSSVDNEVEWEKKLALKEEEIIKLKEKFSNVNSEKQNDMLSDHSELIREIEVLKNKVEELERDCTELTDENLDLIFKLKQLSKEIEKGNHSGSRSIEFCDFISSNNCENERGLLYEQRDEIRNKELVTNPMSAKLKDLEKVSSDLEIQLERYKNKTSDLEVKLQQRHKELEEKNKELFNLQTSFSSFSVGEIADNELFSHVDTQNVLSEMDKQIRLALAQARSLHSNDNYNACERDIDFVFPSTDMTNQNIQVEDITRNLHELNDLLRETVFRCNSVSQQGNYQFNQRNFDDIEVSKKLNAKGFTAEESEQVVKQTEGKDINEDEFQSTFSEEQEIARLQHSNMELEDLISSLMKENCKLDEDLTSLNREYIDTSKHLQVVEHDLLMLTGSMELQASTHRTLASKSAELEVCKNELELHASELEQENIRLSERVSDLEYQLRYLTNEKEANRSEQEENRSIAADLKSEVQGQKAEMEKQKIEIIELKQKLQETQKRLSEVLEESDLSSRSNSTLQATIENLIEECSSLQKLTGELKRQKMDLQQHITHLEFELDESKKKNFDFSKQLDILELKLSSMLEGIASKEKSLLSQLEHIFQDHKEHEEKIEKAHILLNMIILEKTVEVERLEKEIATFTAAVSSNHDVREKELSHAVQEASLLRSEKAKLECDLQEVISKVKLYETDRENLQQETKKKIQGFVDLLNASKQSNEMLMADIKHMQQTIDSLTFNEGKNTEKAIDMESKLKASNYEKQQLAEEISALKVQLQHYSHLQNSILDLNNSLDEANFGKRKLEEFSTSLSEKYEELKAENESLMKKVSELQKAVSSGEDDRHSMFAPQQKLLRLESELSEKEAPCAEEAELKIELDRIKQTNIEYKRKVHSLEQENVELTKKVQIMEKELTLRNSSPQIEKVNSEEVDLDPNILPTKSEHMEGPETDYMCEVQLKRVISEKRADYPEVLTKNANENIDKMSSLEAELREMKERYLHISLQYAEVEAQREQLVMQLKSVKKDKRWFS